MGLDRAVAVAALTLGAVACGFMPAQRDVPTAPTGQLSLEQARAELRSALLKDCVHIPCKVLSARVTEGGARFRVRTDSVRSYRMTFERPIDRIQSEQGYFFAFVPVESSGLWILHASTEPEIRKIADAYLTLSAARSKGPADDSAFAVLAASWRTATPRPALSPAADRERVLAENAFREKDVDAAIEHYEAALESDPTWPTGNFNLALLLAETGDHALAVRHMKRYLLLVPESKDAKVANDKIIVWEEKARAL